MGKFNQLARDHSTCPSGSAGGSLGEFPPGKMVKAFDRVVFETGEVPANLLYSTLIYSTTRGLPL